MYFLNEKQIDIIRTDFLTNNLEYEPLIQELLDHICTDVEIFMSDGNSFEQAYNKVRNQTNKTDLKQIEYQTNLLMNLKSIIMKKVFLIFAGLISINLIFKIFQLNGYNRLLDLTFVIMSIVFFKLAIDFFKDKRKIILNPTLGILTTISGLLCVVPLILWIFDELFSGVNRYSHNSLFANALIAVHIFGLVCFLKYFFEIKESKVTLNNKRNFPLLIISIIYLLFLPLVISDYFGYYFPFTSILVKLSLIIHIFVIIPYLIFYKKLENRHIVILVLFGFYIGIVGINKNYLFSKTFSRTYQSEIIINTNKTIINNNFEILTYGKKTGNSKRNVEMNYSNQYSSKLPDNWDTEKIYYSIKLDETVIKSDSLILNKESKNYVVEL